MPLTDTHQWWHDVCGADWRHPEGPGSSNRGREKHPVAHRAPADAAWAGKQLPSEREGERAARGNLPSHEFVWGEKLYPGGWPMANTWQGAFPHHNSKVDGYERISPVGSVPVSPFGLVDMTCRRYRHAARMAPGMQTSMSHPGFRCVVRMQA